MRILDNAIAAVAPSWALSRAVARIRLDAARGYDAAQKGRRASSFRRDAGSANNEIGRALPALRARSRELVRNTFIGQRALDVLTSHVVGTDLSVRFDTGSDRQTRIVQALWSDWTRRCDIEGETNFNGLLSLAFRSMLEGGDSIIRMVDRRMTDGLPVPMQLHVGEGDLIDETRDSAAITGRSQRARLGVELGDHDVRVGYWLFDQAPSEPGRVVVTPASRLSPRADVVHLYNRLRAGQVRGVPIFAPVLMAARDYADFMDSVVVKARMEAAIGMIIETTDAASNLPATAVTNAAGDQEIAFRPGMAPRLKPGESMKAFAPASNTQFDPVSIATLQGIAAGIGLTYDQLTGDLRQANYSSLRAGKIEFRRLVASLQWNMLVPQVLDRIVDRFIDRAILAGRLRARPEGYARQYVMPAIEPIDPKKDLEADILAVRAGRLSPQDFIEAWGRPWTEVVAETAAFYAVADEAKLIFDIDARQRTRVGQDVSGAASDANAADGNAA